MRRSLLLLASLLVTVFVGSAVWAAIPSRTATARVACDWAVTPGGSIEAALRGAGQDQTICLPPGMYPVPRELRPKVGQTLVGTGPSPAILRCDAAFCIDGADGPTGVTVEDLMLEGAKFANVRAGDRWTIRRVESKDAGVGGIQVRGNWVTIASSYVHDNGAFGIRAVDSANLAIVGNEVAFNPTDPHISPGFAGGVKINAVHNLTIERNDVHDNGGGGGIWLDIDTRHFTVAHNRSLNNEGDGIRVEISCYGDVRSNTVAGASGVGIDLFNAHDVSVDSNVVRAPVGAGFGIRMLSNGRTSAPGDGSCRSAGSFPNANNHATSNTVVTSDPATRMGIQDSGGVSQGNAWASNDYDVPDCAAPIWQWWASAGRRLVVFIAWQALGQDVSGSCA